MILYKLGNLAASMPIKDTEQLIAITNVKLRNMCILHVSSPALHFRATKSYLLVFLLMIFFGFDWIVIETGQLCSHNIFQNSYFIIKLNQVHR